MKTYTPITEEIRIALEEAIGSDCISGSQESLETCAKDASTLYHAPELVLYPETVAHVQAIMKLANIHNFAVTTRGGGSGLAGGCLPIHGGVILSTIRLNAIEEIDTKNFTMKVQPGCISQDVRDAAAEVGLFYPPDPAGMDQSTIGGNAATDAGGPACVKYGTTRDYILGLEAVLPNGTLIKTGVQTRKGVVGYDLTNLIVGSEGTLGVITSLTIQLIAKPEATTGFMCLFPDMVSAMNGVASIMSKGHLPSAIEFMDHKCLHLVGELLPFTLPGGKASALIIEIDGPQSLVMDEIETIKTITREAGAMDIVEARNEEERSRIWGVRRQVSLRIHEYAHLYIPEDIVVPISKIADLVEALPSYEEKYGFEVFAFGHSGDGNIHLNITTQKPEQEAQALAGTRALLELTISLGGTISGEHGIGIAKAEFVAMEIEEESIELQKQIKTLFDPNMISNPGKLFI